MKPSRFSRATIGSNHAASIVTPVTRSTVRGVASGVGPGSMFFIAASRSEPHRESERSPQKYGDLQSPAGTMLQLLPAIEEHAEVRSWSEEVDVSSGADPPQAAMATSEKAARSARDMGGFL